MTLATALSLTFAQWADSDWSAREVVALEADRSAIDSAERVGNYRINSTLVSRLVEYRADRAEWGELFSGVDAELVDKRSREDVEKVRAALQAKHRRRIARLREEQQGNEGQEE